MIHIVCYYQFTEHLVIFMLLDRFRQRKLISLISPVSKESLVDLSVLDDPAVKRFIEFFDCNPKKLDLERLSIKMACANMYPLAFRVNDIVDQKSLFESLERYGFEGLESFIQQTCEMSFIKCYESMLEFPVLEIKENDYEPYHMQYSVVFEDSISSYSTFYEDDGLYACSDIKGPMSHIEHVLERINVRHPKYICSDGEIDRAHIALMRGNNKLVQIPCFLDQYDTEAGAMKLGLDWSKCEFESKNASGNEIQTIMNVLSPFDRRLVRKQAISADFGL